MSDTLGPCGCIDYHYADCPTINPAPDPRDDDEYWEMYWD